MRDRVVVSSLMEEAIATSQIEGAVTTRQVAKEMLRTNRKPKDRSEQMILNSYRTIQLLRQRVKEPLTLEFLFEIQRSMTQGTLDDPTAAGRFRAADEQVTVVDSRDGEVMHIPPPAEQLEACLVKMIAFANAPGDVNSFIHPLVKAAILHFWLAYEHPFVDGNGRTARALFYWQMLRCGYWLFEFLTISRVILNAPSAYYEAFLHSEHDRNDLTYFVMHQLKTTRQALGQLREYLALKQQEQREMATALRRFPDLNHRQRGVLQEALRDPSKLFTFASHQAEQNVTLVTARTDLIKLAGFGLLQEVKQGRQRAFLAAADLPERLAVGKSRAKPRKK
jgi:Fic family protein